MLPEHTSRCAAERVTRAWWPDTTLGADLGIADASTGEIYTAMDWLVGRQDSIEKKLAAKHLGAQANPSKMALFDLSSTWMTGNHCELAARGYSRDGKKGLPQINFGLLGDREGRPVAVRVFAGNTADPTASTTIVADLKDTFTLDDLVMVGDRGMITTARINALRELNEAGAGFGWITAARTSDRGAGRRPRPYADDPVRHPRPGRDRPPRLSRRTPDRLPQPIAGRPACPQTCPPMTIP
jgi:hypothetical protein